MEDLKFQFYQHCHDNNQEGVRDCLNRGVDVNTLFADWTALMWACAAGHSAMVSRLVKLEGIDINYQSRDGSTAAHLASYRGETECLRILAETGKVEWNRRDNNGATPLYTALIRGKYEAVAVIIQQPNFDYKPLLFKAIREKELDLVKMILLTLEKRCSGSSLARIAVEMGEEEDVRLLVQSGSVDWNEQVGDEDPAILWALKNEKFGIVDILSPLNKINMQGDPSTDLTINCGSETFKVHKYFLCSKSSVFRAQMERWEKGEIEIGDVSSDTVRSMIHFVYTGELAEDWSELDIQDMAMAADMYDLPGWPQLICSQLRTEELSGGEVAYLIIIGSRFSAAKELTVVAREKIRQRKDIIDDPAFREKLSGQDNNLILDFFASFL